VSEVQKSNNFHYTNLLISRNDVLVWGSNKNYNLGIGNEQNTNAPQAVDFFRKSNLFLEQVALVTYRIVVNLLDLSLNAVHYTF